MMWQNGMKLIATRSIDSSPVKKSVLILGHFFLFFGMQQLLFCLEQSSPVMFLAQLLKLAILAGCPFLSAAALPHWYVLSPFFFGLLLACMVGGGGGGYTVRSNKSHYLEP